MTMIRAEFIKYVLSFYGPKGIYPMGATVKQIEAATDILIGKYNDEEFDSVSRERVRDILIDKYGVKTP